jgi:hypothetical protein
MRRVAMISHMQQRLLAPSTNQVLLSSQPNYLCARKLPKWPYHRQNHLYKSLLQHTIVSTQFGRHLTVDYSMVVLDLAV